jgi:hypothetical protein
VVRWIESLRIIANTLDEAAVVHRHVQTATLSITVIHSAVKLIVTGIWLANTETILAYVVFGTSITVITRTG